MNRSISFFVLLFFYACHQIEAPARDSGKQVNAVTDKVSVTRNADTLPTAGLDTSTINRLESFPGIPREIDGCSGLFVSAQCELNCAYLMVTDLQGKAFVQIDGRLVKCDLIKRNNNGKRILETFKAGALIITLEAEQYKQLGDELWEYRGTIQTGKEGKESIIAIKGEVGC